MEQEEEQFDPEKAAEEYDDDEEFDFGKAKMDFFKQRARQILVEAVSQEQVVQRYPDEEPDEYAYEGKPLALKLCY